jgi:hypothetical protein
MTFRLKQELKSFIAAEDYLLCATLTPDRPVTIDEFTRYVDIFFTQLDSGIYGKNLLGKNDASNRQLSLHPEANALWNSKERVGLERNRKGYMNGLHRQVMLERKEVSVNVKAVEQETWEQVSGIVVKIIPEEWNQEEKAKSNKRKVSQLINRYDRAWWHCHFICSLPKDIDEYNYKRLQRRIERTWNNLQSLYVDKGKKNRIIGSCMVKPFKDQDHQQRCHSYIIKQVSSYSFNKVITDNEIPESFYYEKCSNTGVYRELSALEKAQKGLRQQSAIGKDFNQFS